MSQTRPYEDAALAQVALPSPSGDFRADIMAFVAWCGETQRNVEDARIRLNMPREPYGQEWGSPGNDLDLATLQAQVERNLGNAWPSWEQLYRKLNDASSRELLVTLLAYRSIGWRYVRLPLNNERFWNKLAEVGREELALRSQGSAAFTAGPYSLVKFDLSKRGLSGEIYSDTFGVFNEFLYSQYVYRGEDFIIAPRPGDYVIDCGACFGGTSVFFAKHVAPEGRVLSFEFMPGNLQVYQTNVALNPDVSGQIDLVQAPVWSGKGLQMTIEGSGPAARVDPLPEGATVPEGSGIKVVNSTSIDAEVARLGYPRVDLIKMDIEGSEYQALLGARATIERFQPTLALSVYHKLCDFYDFAEMLDSWGMDYRYYLQHSTPHGDETVIFCVPPGRLGG